MGQISKFINPFKFSIISLNPSSPNFKNFPGQMNHLIKILLILTLFLYSTKADDSPVLNLTSAANRYPIWSHLLNESADPCLDFYKFTCGQYLDDFKFPFLLDNEYLLDEMMNLAEAPVFNCQVKAILSNVPVKSSAVRKMRLYRDAYLKEELLGWNMTIGEMDWNSLVRILLKKDEFYEFLKFNQF